MYKLIEEFEDVPKWYSKEVDNTHIMAKKKKTTSTNNDLQNTTQKTKPEPH
jgi:hypothetical protein